MSSVCCEILSRSLWIAKMMYASGSSMLDGVYLLDLKLFDGAFVFTVGAGMRGADLLNES